MRTAIAIVMAVCLWSGAAFAQGARYDSIAQSTAVVGGVTVVVPLPGAAVTVCNYPATGQTSTTPCTNTVSVYTDQTLTVTTSNPVTADAQGNFGFFVTPGAYDYSVCTTIPVSCSTPFHVFVPAGQSLTTGLSAVNIENCRNADVGFSGADIVAKANAAAAAFSGAPGCVVIPSGTYNSVTTTLTCANNLVFYVRGVIINYSGAGRAVQCQNVQNAGILGPAVFSGPGTGGATFGLYFGIGSGGNGTVTTYNTIENVQFTNFHTACKLDGSGSNNGTYTNKFIGVYCNNSNVGWSLVPTVANFANANVIIGGSAIGNLSDGVVIDGSNGTFIQSFRSELNGGYCYNFSGVSDTNSVVIGPGWSEACTLGDFRSGSGTNVRLNHINDMQVNSTPNLVGDWSNGNITNFTFSAARQIEEWSVIHNFHISSHFANGFTGWQNDEGGTVNMCGPNKTGPNAGQFFCGTPEYPLTPRGDVVPDSAGTRNIGTNPLPFLSIAIGSAANTATKVTSVATANRAVNWPDAAGAVVLNGNGNNSIQAIRPGGCATGAAAGSTCTITATWPSAFPDTSYTTSCIGQGITSGVPVNGGITAKAAGSVQFITVAGSAAAAQYTTIECWAKHD